MFLHLALFFGLVVVVLWFCSNAGMYFERKKYFPNEPKLYQEYWKFVILALIAILVLIGYLAGNLYLWDTAMTYKDMAVVQDGKVVELGRTFVWTTNGTSTMSYDKPRSYMKASFSVPGVVEDPSFIVLVIYPDSKIPDLEMANMQYQMKSSCTNVLPGDCIVGIARIAVKPGQDDSSIRASLEREFLQYGWHIAGVAVVRIPPS